MTKPSLGYTGETKTYPHRYEVRTRVHEVLATHDPDSWVVRILWDVFHHGVFLTTAVSPEMAEAYVASHREALVTQTLTNRAKNR